MDSFRTRQTSFICGFGDFYTMKRSSEPKRNQDWKYESNDDDILHELAKQYLSSLSN